MRSSIGRGLLGAKKKHKYRSTRREPPPDVPPSSTTRTSTLRRKMPLSMVVLRFWHGNTAGFVGVRGRDADVVELARKEFLYRVGRDL